MAIDYDRDASIDETALDVEWLRQPMLMIRYGKLTAKAKLDADHAKETLDFVKAEISNDVRLNPVAYNLGKPSIPMVADAVLMQQEYKTAMADYLQKKYEFDLVINAMKAIDQKKTALENLVRLHGQQYFAGPSVPRDLSKEWEADEKRKLTNKSIKLRRKKKV